MFKIRFTLTILALFICYLVSGQIVPIEKARIAAKNMYYERANINGKINHNEIVVSEDIVISENNQPVMYVFNIAANDGFVIVSAEERAVPVLSYSFSGHFSESTLPDNYRYWLGTYKKQIVSCRERNDAKLKQITDMWDYYTGSNVEPAQNVKAVSPLMTLKWGQGQYYNAQCPIAYGSVRNPTGCVATSMAMVMKYHAYPSHGYSSHSYVHSVANGFSHNYGTLTANFGSTTYNWSSMPTQVTSSNTAVATIMYHCGVSVDMDYDINGSGAFMTDATDALTRYFVYHAIHEYKAYNSDADWKAMIKADLDLARPIIYAGQDPGGGGGHAFILDGYQGSSNDHFHFNWGWDGDYNSYEYLTSITPTGGDFTADQEAIFQIYPSPATTPVANFTANKTSLNINEFVLFTDQSTNTPLDWTWVITPSTGFSYISNTTANSKNPIVKFTAAGTYTIALTATNAAGSNTKTRTNYIQVGSSDISDNKSLDANINIYPNPTQGLINIQTGQIPAEEVSVRIYDIIGNEIELARFTKTTGSHLLQVDMKEQPKGLYFIKIITSSGSIARKVELTR